MQPAPQCRRDGTACVNDAAIAWLRTPGKRNRLIPPRPDPATHGGNDGHRLDLRRTVLLARHPQRGRLHARRRRHRARAARRQPGVATLSQPARGERTARAARLPSPRAATRKRCSLPPRRVRQPDRGALRRERRRRGRADTVRPGSCEIALLAAGGVITAIDAVLDGTVDNVYALTPRSPRRARPGARLLHLRQRGDRRRTRARLEASSGLQSSTGTSTTATAPRRSSTTTRPFSRSRVTRTTTTRRTRATCTRSAWATARATASTSHFRRARASAPTSRRTSESLRRHFAGSGRELVIVASGLDASAIDRWRA